MSKYFEISGYWLDNGEEFEGYVVKEFDDLEEDVDEDIFEFGWAERDLQSAIEAGNDTVLDFVVTSYEEINWI